jgi:site-specific recombinase XerD
MLTDASLTTTDASLTLSAPGERPLSPELVAGIGEALEASASKNTRRAYRADWRIFAGWCEQEGRCALPASPATLAAFLVSESMSGRSVNTLRRRLATISKAHTSQVEGPSPTSSELVKSTFEGIRRQRAEGHGKGAAPIGPGHVFRMVRTTPRTATGLRDRAAVLLALTTGARRSELVALNVEDIDWTDPRGIVVLIRKSKTDQAGHGREVSVTRGRNPETCPVRTLRAYLEAAGIEDGPVFRRIDRHGTVGGGMTGRAFAGLVKRVAERAGMDSSKVSPHSFRAGHVSARLTAGEGVESIMDSTGHRSVEMVKRYDRASRRFRADVSGSLGL